MFYLFLFGMASNSSCSVLLTNASLMPVSFLCAHSMHVVVHFHFVLMSTQTAVFNTLSAVDG